MTAPTAEGAIDDAAAGSRIPSGSIPNINPLTGLSTDYLNHFTEAVMALEMAASMPECLDDLRAWGPKSYVEHFAASRFSHRAAVIDAYRAADGATRTALDAASTTLHATILELRAQCSRPAAPSLSTARRSTTRATRSGRRSPASPP